MYKLINNEWERSEQQKIELPVHMCTLLRKKILIQKSYFCSLRKLEKKNMSVLSRCASISEIRKKCDFSSF